MVVIVVSQVVCYGVLDVFFCFNGEDFKLVFVYINDELWIVWKEEEGVLVISNLLECFMFKIINEISLAVNIVLEGFYQLGDVFCIQCEVEGFCYIMYYFDCLDVLVCFIIKIIVDKIKYFFLFFNGNCVV